MTESPRPLTRLDRACRIAVSAGLTLLVLGETPVWACPVCFGAADSSMTQGMNMAIGLMLGVLACVGAGFVMFFIRLFKLSRAHVRREPRVPRTAGLGGSY